MKKLDHFIALVVKNFIRFKRNKFGSFCEILFPIIATLMFFFFRSQFDKKENDE